MELVNIPQRIAVDEYDKLIDQVLCSLGSAPGFVSLYQMGSVKHPGISDLDLICVFERDAECRENIRGSLTREQTRILTHSVFGTELELIEDACRYNFLSSLRHLGGETIDAFEREPGRTPEVSTQIALEYLVRAYVALSVQVELRILDARSFLLLAKALEFDLDLLEIESTGLRSLIREVVEVRSNWFTSVVDKARVVKLITDLQRELGVVLEWILRERTFFLPYQQGVMPGGFLLTNKPAVSFQRKGVRLPSFISRLGKRGIRIQLRTNSFELQLPIALPVRGSEIEARFAYVDEARSRARRRYPNFMPLTSSLVVKSVASP